MLQRFTFTFLHILQLLTDMVMLELVFVESSGRNVCGLVALNTNYSNLICRDG